MLDYYSKNKTFFLDYLPDEFFINLNDRERINYRIVRENHAEYIKINEEISALVFEIKQKKQKIKRLKKKMVGSSERPGFKLIMEAAKEDLKPLIDTYNFSLSIGFRIHKTKKKSEASPKLYLRVQNHERRFKNIYIGKMGYAKTFLSEVSNSSSENMSIDDIKDEIKYVYSSYIRHYIWKNDWDQFLKSKHDLAVVKEWSIKMGSDRFRW
tara:strand:- start:24 stop:656 length:633 start_codon:yes stop_codon:yes gene_type:complete